MSENFEQRVKSILDEVHFEPHDNVWHKVKDAIRPEKKKRRFIYWWLLPFILAGGMFAYIMTGTYNKTEFSKEINKTSANKNPVTSSSNAGNDPSKSTVKNNIPGLPDNAEYDYVVTQADKKNLSVKAKYPNQNQDFRTKENGKTKLSTSPVENSITSGVDTASIVISAIAKHDNIKDSQITDQLQTKLVNDTAKSKGSTIATEKNNRASKSKWKFGLTAEIGIANTRKGLAMSTPSISRVSFTSIPNSTSTGSVGATFYQRTTQAGQSLYSIGITAQKNISDKLTLQSLGGYQHQQFINTTTIYKDSASPVFIERNAEKYDLKFVNIYTGISYKFAQVGNMNLSAGAGIDNQFLLAVNYRQSRYIYNSGLSTFDRNRSRENYNIWQPHIRLQFTADVISANRNSLQLSPYLRYGVRKLEKTGNKNHLMSFGLTATYFLK